MVLRAYGVGTVKVGHGAIAGTAGRTTTGPGLAGSAGTSGGAAAGGSNRPVYSNAEGMMIGTPWTPLDQNTREMSRLTAAMQRYFRDDSIDLYAQTGWVSALLLEHALRQMGTTITRQNLINTLNTKFANWNTQFGRVDSFSSPVHDGPLESALIAVQGAGTADWRLVTVHDAING